MVRAVYALLVGIDQYRPPVRPLGGCVNDIGVMETFLRERVGAENGKLELRVLRNEEATREAVIAGFREHLRKAGSEDVALFYHSGHGSQERTPPEFLYLEPDGLDETLVCYDSRTEGHWDLADKELSKLIWEVAERNPHVVVVLDSCHSGSGTRAPEEEDVVRRVPTDERERPISSFIVTAEEAKELSSQRGKAEDTTGWVALPQGRHVLLSACRADEESKEQTLGGARRGVFSYFLTDTLQQTGESLLYRDLFKRVSALVRNRVARQSPQIEATSLQDLDRPFLGGAIAPRSPSFTLSYDPSYGWVIDGGAVHGIPRVTAGETTILALFPFTSSLEQLRDLSSSLGDARVTDVQPHLSRAEVKLRDGGRPDPEQTYKAIVTALPLPLTGVRIEGDEEGVKLVREALVKANPDEGPSLYVREDNTDQKELRLVAGGDKYRIMRAADARSLVLDIQGYTAGSARQAVERLEHIARWLRTAELANPTSRIPADAVRLEVYREDPSAIGGDQPKPEDLAESGGQLRLEYEYRDGKWQQPRVWIKLVNTSNERLYCALLDLTQKYAVKANLVTGEWQDGHQETWALSGKPVYVSVPVDLWQQGVTEYRDLLKLIVSTDQFDATLLEQEALDVSVDRSERATRGFERMSTLNRLMRRVQMRDAGSEPEGNEAYADWNASEIGITTVRPLESVQVPEAGKTAPLGAGVTVVGHASLKARARLTTASQASRDLGTIVLPRLLRDDPSVSQPFEFSASRGGEAGLSVLELLDIDDPAVVTPAQPLLLRVATTLQDDEHVLPVGYDGEFFLPLGYTRGAGSATEIEIERLPPPESVRDLKGSVRIFFQKVISTHLGLEYQYPLLAATDLADDGEVRYTEGLDAVRARV